MKQSYQMSKGVYCLVPPIRQRNPAAYPLLPIRAFSARIVSGLKGEYSPFFIYRIENISQMGNMGRRSSQKGENPSIIREETVRPNKPVEQQAPIYPSDEEIDGNAEQKNRKPRLQSPQVPHDQGKADDAAVQQAVGEERN